MRVIVQPVPNGEGLTTILMHTSGEFLRANTKMTLRDQTPQGQGSAITYMRRYALSAVLGIATEEDDDGNASVHGKEIVALPIFYCGAVVEAEKLVAPLRTFRQAHGEHIGPQPYVQWQKAFDPLLTPSARNYWKSHNFTEHADGALDSAIEFAGKLPSPQCEIFIGLIAGAPNRVGPNAMAYGHRDAKFVLNVHGQWDEAKEDQK